MWQRRELSGSRLEQELEFWKRELEGAPPALDLVTDKPRPAMKTYAGATVLATVETDVIAGLRDIAAREGATLFMVLFASYCALLSRYSRQQDIVVGTPVAGRTHPDTEALVGMFVNTIPLRAKWGRTQRFRRAPAHRFNRRDDRAGDGDP